MIELDSNPVHPRDAEMRCLTRRLINRLREMMGASSLIRPISPGNETIFTLTLQCVDRQDRHQRTWPSSLARRGFMTRYVLLISIVLFSWCGCAYRYQFNTGLPPSGERVQEWRHIGLWGWIGAEPFGLH